jgi:isochorismate hydrolase
MQIMHLTSQPNLSRLIIIDMQIKLASAMDNLALETTRKNCGILLQAAKVLDVPALYTEQYPKGLGATMPELEPYLNDIPKVEKNTFSCCEEPKFNRHLTTDRPQMILAGMEAHICILQTALSLTANHQVFIAEDAIISRNPSNKANAIHRLRDAGCIVTNTESVVFEWLKTAENAAFKQISRLVR